ncbi:MAG: hypothetical protein JWM14_2318 [Chitinophagaceae bacterium]|nr:hypothetical protein [Chitinophagaceae bacterium]
MNKDLLVSIKVTDDVYTYRRLRKAIGVLGVLLPITLCLFSVIPFFETYLQPSISDYYYTHLRELFTGVLCAVGLFLIRYKGHSNPNFFKDDSRLTNIAGFMAFGIAFMPTNPHSSGDKIFTLIPLDYRWLGWIHYGFAGAFFITLAIISINVFTIGQAQNKEIPVSIINENNIYKLCGYLMLLFIVLTPICAELEFFTYSTLVFEALMLFAFGISWLIKGRIIGDKGKIGRKIYREFN